MMFDLDRWLNEYIWPLEARLNDDYVYWSSMLACMELVRSGATTFLDMYFWEKLTLEAAEKVGIRPIFTPRHHRKAWMGKSSAADRGIKGFRRLSGE